MPCKTVCGVGDYDVIGVRVSEQNEIFRPAMIAGGVESDGTSRACGASPTANLAIECWFFRKEAAPHLSGGTESDTLSSPKPCTSASLV